jgi:hypothetical protein
VKWGGGEWKSLVVAGLALALTGCGWALDDFQTGLLAGKEQDKTLVAAAVDTQTYHGQLDGAGQYALFDLGASAAGDRWTIFVFGMPLVGGQWVLALFDGDNRLLWRDQFTSGRKIEHVLNADTGHLYAAVMSLAGGPAGFDLFAARAPGAPVPPPQAQVVWLNFDGAPQVQIARQPAVSCGPFDAADLGAAYAGQTKLMMAEIMATVCRLYADYNVLVLSSDETLEPIEPHSTIHFGGRDGTYIGMGDDVDRDNADHADQAIVYTGNFAPFWTMGLTPEEMARMVGNTAGHELGHLLGLFHTRGSQNVMDDTRSAWDLAGESYVESAPLAETVFPLGNEDAPAVLAETVGLAPATAAK